MLIWIFILFGFNPRKKEKAKKVLSMIFKILAVESQLSSSKVEHPKTVTAESALDPVESQNINLFLCITKVVKQLQEIITEYFRSHVFPIQVSKNEKKIK